MSSWMAVMPSLRAADLEVHVAEVIFLADDVGEQGVLVPFLHQADAKCRRPAW